MNNDNPPYEKVPIASPEEVAKWQDIARERTALTGRVIEITPLKSWQEIPRIHHEKEK